MKVIFRNRREAGEKLAAIIKEKYPNLKNAVVLSLPRGGVAVGVEIALRLHCPLDVMVTRKIGHPLNPEYAIAAVSQSEIISNPMEEIDPHYLIQESKKERQEILRRTDLYRRSRHEIALKSKTVFIVDDGVATGLTMKAAIREVKSKLAGKIVVVIPVISLNAYKEIKKSADEIITLIVEKNFMAVSQFYVEFAQLEDVEVINLLNEANTHK